MKEWDSTLLEKCYKTAILLMNRGHIEGDLTVEQITETLYKLEQEKIEKNKKTDALLDYNDEIVSIEEVGQKETIDISVSGDNLFFCNNLLTKNSFGLPASADLMLALISTEELEQLGQIMVKQLKNRYNDPSTNKRFVIGVDRSKMKLYDLEGNAQVDISDSGQKLNNNTFDTSNKRDKFKQLKVN